MKDQYNRQIEYMRISITDRCNLRCKYCMPDGLKLLPMNQIMSYEDILLVCEEAVKLGITKFKITGGEPLVRKGCVNLVRNIKSISGVEQVTMTTNGVLLANYLDELIDAGLDAVNISLDTLKRDRFQEIVGFDYLDKVLKSIHMATETGIRVKVNAVLQRDENEEEWKDLMLLAKDQRLDVRFIELMPIGQGGQGKMVSNKELLCNMRDLYPDIVEDHSVHGNGPAVYYHVPGWKGSIGFISPIHGVFCGSCNRIRMTSTGEVKPCLCFGDSVQIKAAANSRDREAVHHILQQAILSKPQHHSFDNKKAVTEQKAMVEIGG